MVRVDRGCNVDCKFDLARLMELLGEQPSLTWLELDASEVHRDANCPQRKRPKPGAITSTPTSARAAGYGRATRRPTGRSLLGPTTGSCPPGGAPFGSARGLGRPVPRLIFAATVCGISVLERQPLAALAFGKALAAEGFSANPFAARDAQDIPRV